MLPKNKRIPRELFKGLLEQKKYFNSPHFTLRAAPGSAGAPRFAVSVSKKVSKLATARNRARRRAYSAIAPLSGRVRPGLFLFIAKPGADKVSGERLEKEIEQLMKEFFIK